ncbi:MAG: hypothetical protein ACI4XM_06380 [Candidatus Coprovivens sp.]
MVNVEGNATKKVKNSSSKKKSILKKMKIVFTRLLKKIVNWFKELWKKFMSLPSKTRYIVYVWLVIFILIISLILLSNSNKVFLQDYIDTENAISSGALDYVTSNSLYPVKENKLKLDLDFLREDNYVYDSAIKDNSCTGFSLVYYDDKNEDYVVNSYINCDKYTTKGYSDYK